MSDDEGPIVKLECYNCGFKLEKPEAYMPAHVIWCRKCGSGMKWERR